PSSEMSTSETPPRAESAFVCALNWAMPLLISVCTAPPLRVAALTDLTGLSMSGWWLNTRSASSTTASAMTASMGSRANRIDRTSASGSPTANPTESQDSARAGGHSESKTLTQSLTFGCFMGPHYYIREAGS